jgi:two-component system alkaline phosphatase synthesis response regulator PhoP
MTAHVLAVDDENNIRRLVEVNLQRAGYRVSTAMDGIEALEKIRAERPDLVVLDVMMPRMDGFELLKQLKSDPETADLPVMMLTARAQDADIFRGWQSGADGYLTKPFNPQELLTWVRRTLEAYRDDGTGDGGRIRIG